MTNKKSITHLSFSSLSRQQWIIAILFSFVYLFAACVMSLQAPFYPAEAERKGASSTEYGLVFGVYQLVMFILSPIFGKHMTTLGAKFVLYMGMLTSGFSCFIFGFLSKVNDHTIFITMSFIIRMFEAIGGTAICTSTFTIVAEQFPSSVATTFATLETFYGLGSIIGPTLGGALYQAGGFLLPFAVMSFCLVISGIVTAVYLPTPNDNEDYKTAEGFSLHKLLKHPSAALAAISIFISSNSIGFLNACLEPHLRQFQFTELQVGLVFMSTGAAYAISAPFWGKLMDKKLHPKYVMPIGSVFIIISHLMIGPAVFVPSDTDFTVTSLGLLVHGVGVGAIQVASFVLALRDAIANGYPDSVATYSVVSGLWASGLSLGLFVGPSLGGLLLDQSGYRESSLFPFAAAVILLILTIAFLFYDRKNKNGSLIGETSEKSNLLNTGTIPRNRKISQEYRGTLHPSIVDYGTAE